MAYLIRKLRLLKRGYTKILQIVTDASSMIYGHSKLLLCIYVNCYRCASKEYHSKIELSKGWNKVLKNKTNIKVNIIKVFLAIRR